MVFEFERTIGLRRCLILICLCSLLTVLILDGRKGTRTFNNVLDKVSTSPQVRLARENETNLSTCGGNSIVLSSRLDQRTLWRFDPQCSKYAVSHMIPKCRQPTALASFPGSGNTWLRQLLEEGGGIFTGSMYKDLQLQMFGLWGELRSWKDGTTIVQKTHDASKHHVQKDFDGRGVLILRNPYEAILSFHNFMYMGHHGVASESNFQRTDWPHFVTVQASKWLDMATNWTIHSNKNKLLVVHYEDLKSDVIAELKRLFDFLEMPEMGQKRIECLLNHRRGLFRRTKDDSKLKSASSSAFPVEIRRGMDHLIDHVNEKVLIPRGYKAMPLDKYSFYKKDSREILQDYKERQNSPTKMKQNSIISEAERKSMEEDKAHGTKLVLDQTLRWMSRDNSSSSSTDGNRAMLDLLKAYGMNDTDAMSRRINGFISTALEVWPKLQRPFVKDPITDTIEKDGYRGNEIKDLYLPT